MEPYDLRPRRHFLPTIHPMLWGSRNGAAARASRWRDSPQQSRWWDWVEALSEPPEIGADGRGPDTTAHHAVIAHGAERHDLDRP